MNRETKIAVIIILAAALLLGILLVHAGNEDVRRHNYHKERMTLCWHMLKLSERQNEAIIDLLIEIRDALIKDNKVELRRRS